MPRQNRRRSEDAPRPSGGAGRTEDWNGVEHRVQAIRGQAALKTYRCPGCDQEIAPGLAHLVAWPCDDVDGDQRRHWHSGCWTARGRRRPDQLRSRNAPRY